MRPASSSVRPARITVAYVLISSAWIAGTDLMVSRLPNSPALSIVKGWMFVTITGLLLYGSLFRMRRSLERSEEEARLTESRFRALVESAPDGIYFRVGDNFQYANPAALRCFGATDRAQVEGTPVLSRFPLELRPFIREKMAQIEQTGRPLAAVEVQCLRLDGSLVDVELTAVPTSQGGVSGSLVFFRDITDRKQALEESRRLEEQFRQAQKMESLGRLAGNIAHDFNNYLMVINGYTDLLLKELDHGSTVRAPLDHIRLAGERAAALTRQLLTFSRRDTGQMVVFDLNDAIRDIEGLSSSLLGEDILLETQLTPRPCPVVADKGWIGQVLMNLLVNARDAMSNGGRISIRTFIVNLSPNEPLESPSARPGRFAVLEVQDEGTGMDVELQKRIFEPFFTTKKPGLGTGLGLSLVYNMVRKCEGWLTVSSEVGRGTKFRIYLPLREVPVAPEQTTNPA